MYTSYKELEKEHPGLRMYFCVEANDKRHYYINRDDAELAVGIINGMGSKATFIIIMY